MTYARSLREIGLDEEPIKSALEAILPDPEESPGDTELRWDNVTEDQVRLLLMHPGTREIIGADDRIELGGGGEIA